MDKKHRKFFVVRGPKQSEGCNVMPKMYQNTFGDRAYAFRNRGAYF